MADEVRLSAAEIFLTPTEEEQIIMILSGKCPHNNGWTYVGHAHNDDAYMCNLCSETGWY